MSSIVEKWTEFCEWQQRPSRVPKLTVEHHQIVICFFRLPSDLFLCTLLLPIIPMKQLSGFPWWRSILNVLLAYVATYFMLMWGIDGCASLYARIMLL